MQNAVCSRRRPHIVCLYVCLLMECSVLLGGNGGLRTPPDELLGAQAPPILGN